MLYKVIGLMSGSSLDGIDIVFVHLNESAGKWSYEIQQTACYPYDADWIQRLSEATSLNALDYQLLHASYGHFIGELVNRFMDAHDLHYKVQLICSHGHTSFHMPSKKMTAQLGEGAAIAAVTGINVISDLRAMDIALGGQGAPIVPIGEKLLLEGFDFFLNLGGIANLSAHGSILSKKDAAFIAFDICPANRVLNMIAREMGISYDADGLMAASGSVDEDLLEMLNQLEYYSLPFPKSLANDFGTDVLYPMVHSQGLSVSDALSTYVEHICLQVKKAVTNLLSSDQASGPRHRLLATGGGAHNRFLMDRLKDSLTPLGVDLQVPDQTLVDYKEALIMALIGVLRWREEKNVLSSVTGASRDSVGGAVWMGN
jgi:anhydro-N-acetylmuramic acid kinase